MLKPSVKPVKSKSKDKRKVYNNEIEQWLI